MVIGGGIAAFAAALRGASEGFAVTVLAPARRQWPEFPETLNAAGFRTLLRLGLTRGELVRNFPEVRERISRWGDSPVQIESRIPGLQGPVVLGKAALTSILRMAALERGSEIVEVEGLTVARETSSGLHFSFSRDSTAHEMECGFAIDASGRPGLLARKLGVRRITLDHLVSFWIRGPARPELACSMATMSIADGWVFWISDVEGVASMALFTAGRKLDTQVNAAYILSCAPAEILQMMTSHEMWTQSKVESFNASSSVLEQAGGSFWLACGDALQTFDPLASKGVAIALEQANGAALAITAALGGNRSMIAGYRKEARVSFSRYVAERNAYYGHPCE